MAMTLSEPPSRAPVRASRASCSATRSSPPPGEWEAAGPAGARRHRRRARACPTSSPATPPTSCSPRSTRSACATAPTSWSRATTSRPTFSIWTTIEECLNPPLIWERDRGCYTTAPFSEPEVVRVPRGHRPGRVRQRRARGGRADPALGRLPPRDVQVRPRRGVHRRAARRCTRLGPRLDRRRSTCAASQVAPRDVVAAALPDPATLGDRMTGRTCAGTLVTGTGKDGAPRATYLLPRRRQRADDARVRQPGRRVADRDQPRRRDGAAGAGRLDGRRRARPRGVRRRRRSSRCWPSYGSPARRRRARPGRRRSCAAEGGRPRRRARRLASMSTPTEQQTRLHGGRLDRQAPEGARRQQALHALRRPHLLDLRRLPRGGHRHRRRPSRVGRRVRRRGLGEGHARSPASPR